MTLSCADRSVTFVNPSPNDWRTLRNHFAIDRRLIDKALIDHRLIADQSQICRRYIAKILALFMMKPIAAASETDLRLTHDLFETSRNQWNLWAAKLVAVSLLYMLKRQLATNLVRRPFGDLLATSIKPFRDLWDLSAIVSCFGRKAIASQSQAMCDRSLSDQHCQFVAFKFYESFGFIKY